MRRIYADSQADVLAIPIEIESEVKSRGVLVSLIAVVGYVMICGLLLLSTSGG